MRGFGGTRFHRTEQRRTGQISALACDLLELADALEIERFTVVGHDWGARTAYTAAVLAPERIQSCVALSVGWAGNDPNQPLSMMQTQNFWYQWLMALDRGERLVRENRRDFVRYIWDVWSPRWRASAEEFEEVATSLENPDWADVTLHFYRARWGQASLDPKYAMAEQMVASSPIIGVPTLVLHGSDDPCNSSSTSEECEKLFEGPYQRVLLDGVTHFPQREDPQATSEAILKFIDYPQ